jgi:hypothetical protein
MTAQAKRREGWSLWRTDENSKERVKYVSETQVAGRVKGGVSACIKILALVP